MLRRLLICVFSLICCLLLITTAVNAQVTDTTHPVSVYPELMALANSKTPKEYIIGGIKVVGTKYLDESLLISISGLTVGDKITIPGSDNFSKAINNLWKQNLFANVQIFFTKLEGNNLYLEIDVTERPRLSSFNFKNISKSEADDLNTKTGLIKGRVITENMKRSAIEAIQKYYADKGFQNASVRIVETKERASQNSEVLTFNIQKGEKVRIEQINFFGNEVVSESKLKKQLKDTKELSRFTCTPGE